MTKGKKTSSYRDSLLESLKDPDEAREYLNAAIEDSRESFLKALRNVAQANNMARVAKEAGVQRETLYRSLSENGNPTLESLLGVLGAVGLQFCVAPTEKNENSNDSCCSEPEQQKATSVGTNEIIARFVLPTNRELFGPMRIPTNPEPTTSMDGVFSLVSALPGFYGQAIMPRINEKEWSK